jgi:hypothetical protein
MGRKYKGGSDSANKSDFLGNPINIVILIVFTALIALLYYYNPGNLLSNYGGLIMLCSMMLFFIMITTMVFKSSGEYDSLFVEKKFQKEAFNKYLKSWGNIGLFFMCIFAVALIIYGVLWGVHNFSAVFVLFQVIFALLIIVGFLALFYLKYGESIKNSYKGEDAAFKSKSFIDFFLNILFYLPCLFIDFLEYIKKEYKIAPKIAWIILGIEIVFIGLRYLLPWLMSIIINREGTNLLKDPIYTNMEHTLGAFEDFSNTSKDNTFSYNYALSFWIWINPQPPGTNPAYTKYTSLLNYGDKPRISYNSSLKTLQVKVKLHDNKSVIIYETVDIPFQKWVNIVINYDSGTLDVFINGELVGTRGGVAPYLTNDAVISGANPGVHGGICNVTYYKKVLSKQQISWLYNSLKSFSNPTLI